MKRPRRRKFVPARSVVPYAGRVFDDGGSRRRHGRDAGFLADAGQGRRGLRGRAWPRFWASRRASCAIPAPPPICWPSPPSPAPSWAPAASSRATKSSPSPPVFPPPSRPFCRTDLSRFLLTTIRRRSTAKVEQLEEAFSPGKTKAVIMAHTLGNPFQSGCRHATSATSTSCGSSRTIATPWAALTTAS